MNLHFKDVDALKTIGERGARGQAGALLVATSSRRVPHLSHTGHGMLKIIFMSQ